MARRLGLDCDPAWFGQLKDKLLFKNLVPNDPLHFRGGQSGRWRDAFVALATQQQSGAIKVAFDFR